MSESIFMCFVFTEFDQLHNCRTTQNRFVRFSLYLAPPLTLSLIGSLSIGHYFLLCLLFHIFALFRTHMQFSSFGLVTLSSFNFALFLFCAAPKEDTEWAATKKCALKHMISIWDWVEKVNEGEEYRIHLMHETTDYCVRRMYSTMSMWTDQRRVHEFPFHW